LTPGSFVFGLCHRAGAAYAVSIRFAILQTDDVAASGEAWTRSLIATPGAGTVAATAK
jgi:hypothetical protein